MAYNKSIATEAQKKFPSQVMCVTTHSLAYRAVITGSERSVGNFSYRDVTHKVKYEVKCNIADHIREFCLSAFTSFQDYATSKSLNSEFYKLALHYLTQMQNGLVTCSHEFYLKYFHMLLAEGKLQYDEFDILMLDEAGDLNEVTFAIFNLLPAKRKLLVGDIGQNIYTFNHTVNCFNLLDASAARFPMTQSFRVANTIAKRIEAFGRSYLDPDFSFKGVPDSDEPVVTRAFISRTNAGLIDKMIDLNALGVPYGLVRPAKAIFELPLLLCSLKPRGFIGKNEFKFIQTDYDDWHASSTLQDKYRSPLPYIAAQHPDDVQLQTAINLLLQHRPAGIIDCYEKAKNHTNSKQNYLLGTAFVFKGLEVDEVTLSDDLNKSMAQVHGEFAETGVMTEPMQTIANLYYVAISRCKLKLNNAHHC